jgi:hypothetical protein
VRGALLLKGYIGSIITNWQTPGQSHDVTCLSPGQIGGGSSVPAKKETTPTPDRCVRAAPIPPAPFFQSKHMGTFPPRSRMAITQMEIPNCKSDRMCEFMRSGARAPFGCPRCPHCPRCQSFHGCRQTGGEVRGAPCSTSLCVGYPLLPMFSPEAWPTHPRLL